MSSIKDLIEYRLRKEKFVRCIKTDSIKLGTKNIFKMHVYKNLIDFTEHIALVKGKIDSDDTILVRMHSLNIFSDLLDPQNKNLSKAIEIIAKREKGVIVIIRNPKKELQTKENSKKTVKKTLKEYGVGAQILVDLGLKKIELITNSKTNIIGIDGFGLKIQGVKKLK